MGKYCYLNGKIIPEEKANINLKDIVFFRAYGIFDFLRTYNKKPFLLKKHLDRFQKSAQFLNLKIPVSQREIVEIIKKLILRNKFRESAIRMILTGGKVKDFLGADYNKDSPTFFIICDELKELKKEFYENGINLVTYEYQKEFPRVKSLNYIVAINLYQSLCRKKNAFDILYCHNGFVLEATTSNFFIFERDKLLTPKENILLGITRNLVLKLAKRKFKIEERNIPLIELKKATESFITSTTKGILPVVKIDNKSIGDGKVGKNTKYLMKLFYQYTYGV